MGRPLPHFFVILLSYSHIICFTSICTNFVCFVLLKLGYLWFFDQINSIYDETILKFMRIVSVGAGFFSTATEIAWKVILKAKFLIVNVELIVPTKFLKMREDPNVLGFILNSIVIKHIVLHYQT